MPTLMYYIKEQPSKLEQTYKNHNIFTQPLIEIFSRKKIKKIIFIGSGTSYHISLSAKRYFQEFLPVEVQVLFPTMFTGYERINNNLVYNLYQIL